MQNKQSRVAELEEKRSDESHTSSLNFKVSPDFKKEFKGYAVSQGVSMVDLLKQGFSLIKDQRQK